MNLRSKLTYSNVVATLALFLVIGGGTVYAAIKLGRNDVESKHIAKGAVKSKDLGKDAVKSPKIKNGGIQAADIDAELLAGLDVDVAGSAAAGPQANLTSATPAPLPLSGDTTFTPGEGEVAAITAEGRFTTATTNAAQICNPAVGLFVNGEETRVFVDPSNEGNNTTPETSVGRDADGPFGLLDPGTPLTVSAQIRGDADCTAATRLDELVVRIVQIR